ncbi:DUF6988 family protein [Burkholderia glumae]|uniref:DUF6988 family protein n=1 Tax=Burkholderia glumae TaxID=337 RepID=UPI0020368CA7|nr:hypothetical protein [Burkholderia glumae]MCM2482401.1 hypothetical protein [Burkholderia glumae]MCM2507455.1 hypothetical protein [Burkholderia glumae]
MFESSPRFGATPENVARALEFATEISDLIDRYHPDSVPVDRPQTAIAMAMFMQASEHRQAIMLLIHHGARSSAAALIRPAFEACYRGFWALKIATKENIDCLLGDHPRIPKLDTVLKELRNNEATRHLVAYDSWKAGDYVHTGSLQLNRWLSSGGIQSLHTDSDAIDMLELSDFCGLLACIGMNEGCGKRPPELEDKLTEHTLRRVTRRVIKAYYGSEDTSR